MKTKTTTRHLKIGSTHQVLAKGGPVRCQVTTRKATGIPGEFKYTLHRVEH
jgi:hypothetical protein